MIEAHVDKGCSKFNRRNIIYWPDGAVSVVTLNGVVLRGTDGLEKKLDKKSQHFLDCKEVLKNNGYGIR